MAGEEYGLITFQSTSFALQGENVFKGEDISFKTIPTPREVSHSCGLAIVFAPDDMVKVKEMIDNNKLSIDRLYRFIKYRDKSKNKVEKIL